MCMEKSKVNEILDYIEELFPDAHCELNYRNVFELIVAVSLSAQTTDKRVNEVTKVLFDKYSTAEELANANFEEVKEIIKPLGLAQNKARNIIALSKKLIEDFNGEVPSNMKDLVSLPGVGRKTANVILSEGFGIPAIAVDTHVSRVANRLGLSSETDVNKIEEDLMNLIDKERWHKAHHLLLFFGRYHCKAKNPLCDNCKFKNGVCKVTM